MEKSYLIALVVVAAAIIAIIVFAAKRNKPIAAAGPTPTPSPAPIAPSAVTYTFYPRKNTPSPSFGQRADLIDNVPALKAACEAIPGCVGFTTNGWFFKSLNPQSTWVDWNGPAGCGIYVRNN